MPYTLVPVCHRPHREFSATVRIDTSAEADTNGFMTSALRLFSVAPVGSGPRSPVVYTICCWSLKLGSCDVAVPRLRPRGLLGREHEP